MFPRHRLQFAAMLVATGNAAAFTSPAAAPRAGHAEAVGPQPDAASQERWLVYVNEMLSHRR